LLYNGSDLNVKYFKSRYEGIAIDSAQKVQEHDALAAQEAQKEVKEISMHWSAVDADGT
jgi:hypothetical protein